ncbi:nuclear transport factor 2-like [Typha latifolia]|uniref:nuclear transport factor 2-like n=1 Tax=Typha latifolia TaxID=4733 RepID=UPI003C2C3BCD
MASPFPHQPKAFRIGTFFLRHYYQILQHQPSLVHQFYANMSTMIRYDGSATETAIGLVQINDLIMYLNFNGIELKTAHCLDSWNGGIIVMVSGFVQLKDYSARRKFVQTFFLAPQENGYFVLNDIFNLLEDELVHQPPAVTFEPENNESKLNTSSPMPAPVSNYVIGEEIQSKELLAPEHKEESEIMDKCSIDEPQKEVLSLDTTTNDPPAEEPAALFLSSTNSMPDSLLTAVEDPVTESPKHTYASILRAKGQSGYPVTHPTSSEKAKLVAPQLNYAPRSTPGQHLQPILAPEKPSLEIMQETSMLEDEGESLSVYVGNLSPSVSISELEQEFNSFGRIKPDGVAIRSRKEAGVYYAFVEFEDITGVQNALKASPLQLNGRLIHVEERRPNGSFSRSGRGGRGRGGYLSDASRGRFGVRSFGRSSILDTSRDYGSRPRVNRYQQRGAHQERGILGTPASRNG